MIDAGFITCSYRSLAAIKVASGGGLSGMAFCILLEKYARPSREGVTACSVLERVGIFLWNYH